jgi:hypothetical protein
VFYRLIMSRKNTRLTSMPIPLNKIIFSKNNPSTKIPCKFFVFKRYVYLPDFLII